MFSPVYDLGDRYAINTAWSMFSPLIKTGQTFGFAWLRLYFVFESFLAICKELGPLNRIMAIAENPAGVA